MNMPPSTVLGESCLLGNFNEQLYISFYATVYMPSFMNGLYLCCTVALHHNRSMQFMYSGRKCIAHPTPLRVDCNSKDRKHCKFYFHAESHGEYFRPRGAERERIASPDTGFTQINTFSICHASQKSARNKPACFDYSQN